MTPTKDVITPKEWVEDSSVGSTTQKRRKLVLGLYAKANGRQTAEEVVADIIADQKTVTGTSRAFMTFLRSAKHPISGEPLKPSTIALYRSMLPEFFESVLGETNFSRRAFDRTVPMEKAPVSTTKKAPKFEQMPTILSLAGPRDRALLGVLAWGMRLDEALSRKMSDIEELGQYARIKLRVDQTKARVKRYEFITKEVLGWIQDYHKTVNSEWVFPGDDKTKRLSKPPAYRGLKALFERAGLKDTDDEIYSPHSMRTFADNLMTKCGLDRKYIELIIGHESKIGASASYKDWDAIGQKWFEACGHTLLWKPVEITKEDTKAREDIEKLKGILEYLIGKGAVDSLMSKSLDQFRKDKARVLAQAQLEDDSGQRRVEGQSK